MLSVLFNEAFYRPLFNALVVLYQTAAFYDLGVAIIILTVLCGSHCGRLQAKHCGLKKSLWRCSRK